eukprot:gene2755-3008_t
MRSDDDACGSTSKEQVLSSGVAPGDDRFVCLQRAWLDGDDEHSLPSVSSLADEERNQLLLSAVKRGNVNVVTLLLQSGADVGFQDQEGLAALHWAALSENLSLARLLVDRYGAVVDLLDKKKESPILKVASTHCNRAFFIFLLRRGANAWIRRGDGLTAMALMLAHPSSHDDSFWCEIVSFDRKACFLASIKSPIVFVNRLWKGKRSNPCAMSDFALSLHTLLTNQDRSVLRILVSWHVSLLRAAKQHPSEEGDLIAFADKVELMVAEVFNCDALDDPVNLQKMLQSNKRIVHTGNLLQYQIQAFQTGELLDLSLRLGSRLLVEKPQVSAFVNDIFWYSASVELGPFAKKKKVNPIDCLGLAGLSWLKDADLARRVKQVDIFSNDIVRLSYGARTCPALRFHSEAVSKWAVVAWLSIVSVFQYAPSCGTIYSSSSTSACYSESPSHWEIVLIVLMSSSILYEVGEFFERGSQISKYLRDEWKFCDVSGLLLLLMWSFVRGDAISLGRLFLALAAIPLSLGLLRYFAVNRSLGVMVSIARAMALDLLAFLAVYLLCVLGFGIFFQSLFFSSPDFHGVGNTALSLFQFTLSDFDFTIFDSPNALMNGLGQVVLAVYLVFTAILLINMLIAKMSNAYQRIDEKALQEWSFAKAQTVQEMLLLKEKHPFCMLMPPFNILPALLLPWHRRHLPSGISVAGTATNAFLYCLSGPFRAFGFVVALIPSARSVLYTFFMDKHPRGFRLYYALSNGLVSLLLVVGLAIEVGCPLLIDWLLMLPPVSDLWMERVEREVPQYLHIPFLDDCDGQSGKAETRDVNEVNEVGKAVELPSLSPLHAEKPVALELVVDVDLSRPSSLYQESLRPSISGPVQQDDEDLFTAEDIARILDPIGFATQSECVDQSLKEEVQQLRQVNEEVKTELAALQLAIARLTSLVQAQQSSHVTTTN